MVVRRGDVRKSLRWWMSGLAFVLALCTVLALAADLPGEGLDRADKVASVGSLVTGAAALLLGGLALWLATRQVVGSDDAALLDQAATKLADAVRRQWTYEAEFRQLRRPRPLRVRWSTTRLPVSAQPAAVLGEGAGVRSGDTVEIAR